MCIISNARISPDPTQTPTEDLPSQESPDTNGLSPSSDPSDFPETSLETADFSTKGVEPYPIQVSIKPSQVLKEKAILIHFADGPEGLCTRVCMRRNKKEIIHTTLTEIYGRLIVAKRIALGTPLTPVITISGE